MDRLGPEDVPQHVVLVHQLAHELSVPVIDVVALDPADVAAVAVVDAVAGQESPVLTFPPEERLADLLGGHAQCRKWRRPVRTIAMPWASAAATTSSSRIDPPG